MSNDLEQERRMKRFKKAHNILDAPVDEIPDSLDQWDSKADPDLLKDYEKYLD